MEFHWRVFQLHTTPLSYQYFEKWNACCVSRTHFYYNLISVIHWIWISHLLFIFQNECSAFMKLIKWMLNFRQISYLHTIFFIFVQMMMVIILRMTFIKHKSAIHGIETMQWNIFFFPLYRQLTIELSLMNGFYWFYCGEKILRIKQKVENYSEYIILSSIFSSMFIYINHLCLRKVFYQGFCVFLLFNSLSFNIFVWIVSCCAM